MHYAISRADFSQKATNFFYITPIENKTVEKEDQTEVMMTYDDRNIYVGVICYGKKTLLGHFTQT